MMPINGWHLFNFVRLLDCCNLFWEANVIRYKLTDDCRNVFADKKGKSKIRIFVRQNDVIFVDLLEKMEAEGICEVVKCRLYWPDGDIQEAYVLGFHITIHNKDEMFDGRFNAVPMEKLTTNVSVEKVKISHTPYNLSADVAGR